MWLGKGRILHNLKTVCCLNDSKGDHSSVQLIILQQRTQLFVESNAHSMLRHFAINGDWRLIEFNSLQRTILPLRQVMNGCIFLLFWRQFQQVAVDASSPVPSASSSDDEGDGAGGGGGGVGGVHPHGKRRSPRALTGKHVRLGTGASPTTLHTLRLKIEERQRMKLKSIPASWNTSANNRGGHNKKSAGAKVKSRAK